MNGEGIKSIALMEKNQCMATVKTISLQRTKICSQAFKLKSKRMHLYHKTWNCSSDNYGLQRL